MNYLLRNITRIFPILFLITFADTYSQKKIDEIIVDTIIINKTKTIKIAKTWTPPRFIFQINGSYNSGALELTGHNGGFSRSDFITGKNFGARNGYGVNLIGKIALHKKANFWLDVVTGFIRFQSDLITKNEEEGKVSYNIFSGGIGAEYNFTPAHKVKYFLGFNPLVSFIMGKATLNNPDTTTTDLTINLAVRLGYSVFMGLDYAASDDVGLHFGLKFTHANLFLKKSTTSSDSTKTDLNDQSVGGNYLYSGWKQFAYATIYGGISFYIGIKERKYKLP